jgi:hypothetical protein
LVKNCPFCGKWKTNKLLLHNENEEQQKLLNDEMNVALETHLKTCETYKATLALEEWKKDGSYDILVPILIEEQFVDSVTKLMKKYHITSERLKELVDSGTWEESE